MSRKSEDLRDIKFERMARNKKTSEQAHCTALNLIFESSSPPGKKVLKTVNSASIKFVVP